MSSRRPNSEVTDPGRPPEEALDATLRALGDPVAPEARRTPESAGLEAAHYDAGPHLPPKAHEPHTVTKGDTKPMATAVVTARLTSDTIRDPVRAAQLDGTTVPRAAPAPSKTSAFAGALLFVLLLLGGATWAFSRTGAPSPQTPSASPSTIASVAVSATTAPPPAVLPSATALVSSEPPHAATPNTTPAVSTAAAPGSRGVATTATATLIATSLPMAPSAPIAPRVVAPAPPTPPAASTSRPDLSPIQ